METNQFFVHIFAPHAYPALCTLLVLEDMGLFLHGTASVRVYVPNFLSLLWSLLFSVAVVGSTGIIPRERSGKNQSFDMLFFNHILHFKEQLDRVSLLANIRILGQY